MTVASKAKMVRLGALLVVVFGLSLSPVLAKPQQHARPSAPRFPKACFFFESGGIDYAGEKESLEEERTYTESTRQFYRLWCIPTAGTPKQKNDAADAMVVAWKRLWDRDLPYNAAFHETGSFDLLALMGITHELPAPMRTDVKFTGEWVENCSYVCFHIDYDPASARNGRAVLMQLWLRNDVLDNLKKEPAAEPVFMMLAEAKFTLVD